MAAFPPIGSLVVDGATGLLTEQVFLASNENALSSVVDVWPESNGPKVQSVTWYASRPWEPPRVVKLRWATCLEALGCPAIR